MPFLEFWSYYLKRNFQSRINKILILALRFSYWVRREITPAKRADLRERKEGQNSQKEAKNFLIGLKGFQKLRQKFSFEGVFLLPWREVLT